MTEAASTMRHQALQCMEIWGGNRAVKQSVSTPGLEIWVYSRPHEQANQGGDVYYASLCGGGLITRFILADVSGHGEAVAEVGHSLRNLMRRHINRKNHTRLVQSLNRECSELTAQNRFATAIVATYLTTGKVLSICNAGHPRPFHYRAREQKWSILQKEAVESSGGLENLPLGVIEETAYTQFEIELGLGDLILFYTDAFPEATNLAGEPLGEAGLFDLLLKFNPSNPARIADELPSLLDAFRGSQPAQDDVSFVLLYHNAQEPPRLSIREKLKVYAKVFGIKSV